MRTSPLVAFTPHIKKKVLRIVNQRLGKVLECALGLGSSSGARWAMEDVRKAEKEHIAQSHGGLGSSTSNMPLPSSDFSLTHYPLLP